MSTPSPKAQQAITAGCQATPSSDQANDTRIAGAVSGPDTDSILSWPERITNLQRSMGKRNRPASNTLLAAKLGDDDHPCSKQTIDRWLIGKTKPRPFYASRIEHFEAKYGLSITNPVNRHPANNKIAALSVMPAEILPEQSPDAEAISTIDTISRDQFPDLENMKVMLSIIRDGIAKISEQLSRLQVA